MAPLLTILIILLLIIIGYYSSLLLFSYSTRNNFSSSDGKEVLFTSGRNTLEGRIWNEGGEKGTILFSHGMGLSADYYLPEIHFFARLGYTVFSYDYRGYGKSEGRFLTFYDSVEDLSAAFDHISKDREKIILMGHSMGGYATAVFMSERNEKVEKAVLYAPFRSPFSAMHVASSWHGAKGRILEVFMYLFSLLLRGRKANIKARLGLTDPSFPVLLIQGNEDNACSIYGCSLYRERECFGKNVRVHLMEEKGRNGHNTILRPKGEKGVNRSVMEITQDFLS